MTECDWCGQSPAPHALPTGDMICDECDDTHEVQGNPPRVVQTKPHSVRGDPSHV